MIDISELYNYGLECKENISTINHFNMADNVDKVVENIKHFFPEDNHLLMCIIPSYTTNGSTSVDDFELNSHLQFLILEKYDIRLFENNYQEMQLFQRTLMTTKEFIDKLIIDRDDPAKKCNFFRNILWQTIQVDPIRYNTDTCGYSITFTCI